MRSIKLEVKQNIQNYLDVDNFRSRYFDYENDSKLYVSFPGFELTTLEKNICYLYDNCSIHEFKDRWYMRPDYTSYDFYNTVIYWPIILYINEIYCIEDFRDLEEVLIPSMSSILEISRDRVSKNDLINVNEVIEEINTNMYYKRFPFDKIEKQKIENIDKVLNPIEPQNDCILKEITEEFVLTEDDITNKYVLIKYQPVNSGSIFFYLDDFSTPQPLGYDYTLKHDSTFQFRKVSWAKDDCQFGNGLEDLLEKDHKVKIKYVYSEVGCDYCPPNTTYNILDGGIIG